MGPVAMKMQDQPRQLPSRAGQTWLIDGIRIFHRQPLVWVLSLMTYWAGLVMVGILPVVGLFLPLLFTPGLGFGFIVLAEAVDRQDPAKPATPTLLLAGFRERKRDQASEILRADGFVEVGSIHEIPDNGAVTIGSGGERIAIFRYGNKVSAVSNVCRHQGGPLGEGRIVIGILVQNIILHIGNTGHKDPAQQQWGYVFDDKPIESWNPDIGPPIDFGPSLVHSEDPCEKEYLEESKNHQTHRSGPIIIVIEDALLIKENRWQSHD